MMGWEKRKLLLLAAAAIVLLQACSGQAAVTEAPTPEPALVKVQLLPFTSFAPYFIAQEEGYYAEQNIEVEFVEIRRFEDIFPPFLQGDVDVISGSIRVGLLRAMQEGVAVRVVADKGFIDPNGCTYFSFMAREADVQSGALDEPADLAGRRVGFEPEGSTGLYLTKLLEPVGLSIDDLIPEFVPPTTTYEAIKNGSIDLGIMAEPSITLAMRGGGVVPWFPSQEVMPGFQLGMVFYGPSLLEERPDVGERFMAAYLKAVGDYLEGKTDRNLDILAKYTGLEKPLLEEICWQSFSEDGNIRLETLLDYAAWAHGRGLLEAPITAEQLWEPRFIQAARDLLAAR